MTLRGQSSTIQRGGSRPETIIDDNMYSNAAMFAAIEASAKSKTVDVDAMVARATRK